jgi:low temperature requirement protein LtrA
VARFQRTPDPDGHSRASPLELFYDLVFVFAVTQVSHYLLDHLTWEGAGQAAVMLLAVWWTWNYTTWATNELDTRSPAVRVLVIALMLGSLMMSVAIPEAWGERALLFAGSYVAINLVRQSFLTFAAGERGSLHRKRASRILIWFAISSVLWIAGAVADDSARTALWLAALLFDYSGPIFMYRVPGLERISHTDWEVASEHFAERFQLFVIIALGESIVLTGATTSELELDGPTVAAFVVAFLGAASLWWLYFNRAAAGSQRMLEQSENRTVLARDVYTYLHAAVIAGVIVSAAGDEIVIGHPDEPLKTGYLLTVVAGPAIFLLAMAIIRRRSTGTWTWRRPFAALVIAAIGLVAADADGLVVASLILAVLVALIAYEEWNYRHRDRNPGVRAAAELLGR